MWSDYNSTAINLWYKHPTTLISIDIRSFFLVEKRQIDFELQSAPALLILDGATQHHCPEALDLLEKNNVKVHFLVPHSSHLTQPLDCLFFKVLKGKLKESQTIYSNLSKRSNRLVHGLSSLSKSIG